MSVAEPIRPKRAWRPWWMLPVDQQPICPRCGVACIATSSPTVDGRKVQHRKCPKCSYTCKSMPDAVDGGTAIDIKPPQSPQTDGQ